jgi:hypothetical protein
LKPFDSVNLGYPLLATARFAVVDEARFPGEPWQCGAVDREQGLFDFLDDLEQHAQALYDADRAGELADRSRSEYAAVTLASRLMATDDREVTLDLLGVGPISGHLRRVGPDWCLVQGSAQDWVIRLQAVQAVEGVSDRSVPEVAWSPVSRLGLGSALRRLAETAAACRVHTVDGTVRDGRLRRIGADFAELAVGESRVVLVARETLAAVQSRDG